MTQPDGLARLRQLRIKFREFGLQRIVLPLQADGSLLLKFRRSCGQEPHNAEDEAGNEPDHRSEQRERHGFAGTVDLRTALRVYEAVSAGTAGTVGRRHAWPAPC